MKLKHRMRWESTGRPYRESRMRPTTAGARGGYHDRRAAAVIRQTLTADEKFQEYLADEGDRFDSHR